jgi:hypothetical protein
MGAASIDPRTLLTIKATKKKVHHIKDFVTDQVKSRITKKRRGDLQWTQAGDGTVSLQPIEEDQVYFTQAEWGAANMRILNHLLQEGEIDRQDIEFYLTYTTMIHELASKWDWQSILAYDARYREQQAEHEFMWGFEPPHSDNLLLAPRQKEQPPTWKGRYNKNNNHHNGGNQGGGGQANHKKRYRGTGPSNKQPDAKPAQEPAQANDDELCIRFLTKGKCEFGEKCKYKHNKDE